MHFLYERQTRNVHVTRKKAAETMFVQKICTYNIDEIDYWFNFMYYFIAYIQILKSKKIKWKIRERNSLFVLSFPAPSSFVKEITIDEYKINLQNLMTSLGGSLKRIQIILSISFFIFHINSNLFHD